jgi:hypothetical protein
VIILQQVGPRSMAGLVDGRKICLLSGTVQRSQVIGFLPTGVLGEQAKDLATKLGPVGERDETEMASELRISLAPASNFV